jgi:hypothetical protein
MMEQEPSGERENTHLKDWNRAETPTTAPEVNQKPALVMQEMCCCQESIHSE